MKIQDIFNLPKNRGGYKLFNKIMNRYGIPKADAKELKKNIDNSSSGGGGNNIEYYTFNINNIPTSWHNSTPIIIRLFMLYKYTEASNKYIVGSAQAIDSLMSDVGTDIIAIAYTTVYMNEFSYPTLKDLFVESGVDITDFDKVFTPITEEEFYDLNKWSLEDYK